MDLVADDPNVTTAHDGDAAAPSLIADLVVGDVDVMGDPGAVAAVGHHGDQIIAYAVDLVVEDIDVVTAVGHVDAIGQRVGDDAIGDDGGLALRATGATDHHADGGHLIDVQLTSLSAMLM